MKGIYFNLHGPLLKSGVWKYHL